MADRSLWVATLKPDKADAYARMHDELPAAIAAQLKDKGFRHLDIYRSGLSLFMVWETDAALAAADRTVREEAELAWERATGDCFAESWREVPRLFRLSDHVHKADELKDRVGGA